MQLNLLATSALQARPHIEVEWRNLCQAGKSPLGRELAFFKQHKSEGLSQYENKFGRCRWGHNHGLLLIAAHWDNSASRTLAIKRLS
jgi:hypothetical protein